MEDREPAEWGADTYAHTREGLPPQEWHRLEDHLRETARLAGSFAARFDSCEWGEQAGLWHDLGKSSTAFQEYLRDSRSRGPDHKSAGAQYAVETLDILGHLIAYTIAGHHGGMHDGRSDGTCLDYLLRRELEPWNREYSRELRGTNPDLPAPLAKALAARDSFGCAFFTRMLFSCLVDADFLDTERFLDPIRSASRPQWPSGLLREMDAALSDFAGRFASGGTVNCHRARVREACVVAASESSGFFSLTVPTGGGKTLSSLAFALRHAIQHDMDRVIYVVPFTSIIEQNADVFRKAMDPLRERLGQDVVLEHHSNLDTSREESHASRLATENWDAPLVVTTSVQFYESLFHNRPSRCRKIHRVARSVVVLDEVQTLPVHLLEPCLRALRELVRSYGTTVVLCTATQPALHRREGFRIGLEDVHEIVPDPRALARDLRRVQVEDLGEQSDAFLAERLLAEDQVLCIVNTRGHAKDLFEAVGLEGDSFHLSALMVPAHRSRVVDRIHVLAPIRFTQVRRNEIKSRIPAGKVEKVRRAGSGELGISVADRDQRQQRASLLLRDVRYGIEAHVVVVEGEERSGERLAHPVAKHLDSFRRRASRGQYFHHPYLGCREFPAFFQLVETFPPPPPELKGAKDLGWMLNDIAFVPDPEGKIVESNRGRRLTAEPEFFRATARDGVIEVPLLERQGGEG